MIAQKTAKKQRTVHILARYEFKEYTDIVCYMIRSSNGIDTYRTCYSAGRVNCGCRGYQEYGHCYHSDEVKRLEQERERRARLECELADWLRSTPSTERDERETARINYELALGI